MQSNFRQSIDSKPEQNKLTKFKSTSDKKSIENAIKAYQDLVKTKDSKNTSDEDKYDLILKFSESIENLMLIAGTYSSDNNNPINNLANKLISKAIKSIYEELELSLDNEHNFKKLAQMLQVKPSFSLQAMIENDYNPFLKKLMDEFIFQYFKKLFNQSHAYENEQELIEKLRFRTDKIPLIPTPTKSGGTIIIEYQQNVLEALEKVEGVIYGRSSYFSTSSTNKGASIQHYIDVIERIGRLKTKDPVLREENVGKKSSDLLLRSARTPDAKLDAGSEESSSLPQNEDILEKKGEPDGEEKKDELPDSRSQSSVSTSRDGSQKEIKAISSNTAIDQLDPKVEKTISPFGESPESVSISGSDSVIKVTMPYDVANLWGAFIAKIGPNYKTKQPGQNDLFRLSVGEADKDFNRAHFFGENSSFFRDGFEISKPTVYSQGDLAGGSFGAQGIQVLYAKGIDQAAKDPLRCSEALYPYINHFGYLTDKNVRSGLCINYLSKRIGNEDDGSLTSFAWIISTLKNPEEQDLSKREVVLYYPEGLFSSVMPTLFDAQHIEGYSKKDHVDKLKSIFASYMPTNYQQAIAFEKLHVERFTNPEELEKDLFKEIDNTHLKLMLQDNKAYQKELGEVEKEKIVYLTQRLQTLREERDLLTNKIKDSSIQEDKALLGESLRKVNVEFSKFYGEFSALTNPPAQESLGSLFQKNSEGQIILRKEPVNLLDKLKRTDGDKYKDNWLYQFVQEKINLDDTLTNESALQSLDKVFAKYFCKGVNEANLEEFEAYLEQRITFIIKNAEILDQRVAALLEYYNKLEKNIEIKTKILFLTTIKNFIEKQQLMAEFTDKEPPISLGKSKKSLDPMSMFLFKEPSILLEAVDYVFDRKNRETGEYRHWTKWLFNIPDVPPPDASRARKALQYVGIIAAVLAAPFTLLVKLTTKPLELLFKVAELACRKKGFTVLEHVFGALSSLIRYTFSFNPIQNAQECSRPNARPAKVFAAIGAFFGGEEGEEKGRAIGRKIGGLLGGLWSIAAIAATITFLPMVLSSLVSVVTTKIAGTSAANTAVDTIAMATSNTAFMESTGGMVVAAQAGLSATAGICKNMKITPAAIPESKSEVEKAVSESSDVSSQSPVSSQSDSPLPSPTGVILEENDDTGEGIVPKGKSSFSL